MDEPGRGLLVTLRADLSEDERRAVVAEFRQRAGVVDVLDFVAGPDTAALEMNDARWRERIVHLLDDEGV